MDANRDRYFVLFRDGDNYLLAACGEFEYLIKAIEYADGIGLSRDPLVVKVIWEADRKL